VNPATRLAPGHAAVRPVRHDNCNLEITTSSLSSAGLVPRQRRRNAVLGRQDIPDEAVHVTGSKCSSALVPSPRDLRGLIQEELPVAYSKDFPEESRRRVRSEDILAGREFETAKLEASTLADVEDLQRTYSCACSCVRKGGERAGTRREMEYLSPGIGIA
jgi:hypothetical protein